MHVQSITTMHTLFNNYPYISSSGTPVGTKYTATYVGIVAEQYAHGCSGVHFTVYMVLVVRYF